MLAEVDRDRPFTAAEDTVARGLAHLAEQRRDLPGGTFLFIVSDFLVLPRRDEWLHALERRFEIVPQLSSRIRSGSRAFPDVSGLAVPFVDGESGRVRVAALSADEAAERRSGTEGRFRELIRMFHGLDMDPVVVSSHEHRDVVFAFLRWADDRLLTRGRR